MATLLASLDAYHTHKADSLQAVRVTHALAEILRDGDPDVRVSHALGEVLRDGSPDVRISHALAEVLRPDGEVAYDGDDVDSDDSEVASMNYRMLIKASDLDAGDEDGFTRISLKGPSTGSVTIQSAAIGRRDGNTYDFDTSGNEGISKITWDGSESVTLPANTAMQSDWFPFKLDKTKDHLLHVFVSGAHDYSWRADNSVFTFLSDLNHTLFQNPQGSWLYNLIRRIIYIIRIHTRRRTELVVPKNYHAHTTVRLDLTQEHFLHDADADSLVTSTSLALTQLHFLEVAGGDSLTDSSALALDQKHILTGLVSAHVHASGNIFPTVHLVVGDSFFLNVPSLGPISQNHALTVQTSVHDLSSGSFGFGQTVPVTTLLILAEGNHLHAVDSLEITADHTLSVEGCEHSQAADGFRLGGTSLLRLPDAAHAHAAGGLDLTADQTLAIDETSHLQEADAYGLGQTSPITTLLTLPNCQHLHTVDGMPLAQEHSLIVAEDYHVVAVDAVVVTALHRLQVAEESAHVSTSDTISSVIVYSTTVPDSFLLHLADAVTITEVFTLEVQEAGHDITSENLVTTRDNDLVVADAASLHEAEVPALSQECELAVGDAAHLHAADNLSVTGFATLSIQSAGHLHTLQDVRGGLTLVPIAVDQEHLADNVILIHDHYLAVADTYHPHDGDKTTATPNSLVGGVVIARTIKSLTTKRTLGSLTDDGEADSITNSASAVRTLNSLTPKRRLAA